jgi:hypothetical protein
LLLLLCINWKIISSNQCCLFKNTRSWQHKNLKFCFMWIICSCLFFVWLVHEVLQDVTTSFWNTFCTQLQIQEFCDCRLVYCCQLGNHIPFYIIRHSRRYHHFENPTPCIPQLTVTAMCLEVVVMSLLQGWTVLWR